MDGVILLLELIERAGGSLLDRFRGTPPQRSIKASPPAREAPLAPGAADPHFDAIAARAAEALASMFVDSPASEPDRMAAETAPSAPAREGRSREPIPVQPSEGPAPHQHPGVEVHSHFMGIASVDALMNACGFPGQDLGKTSPVLLAPGESEPKQAPGEGTPPNACDFLLNMQRAVQKDPDYAGHYQTTRNENGTRSARFRDRAEARGEGGTHAFENVRVVEEAAAHIASERARILGLPEGPEKEKAKEDLDRHAYDQAEIALTATTETPFDGAYSIRDTLVKQFIDPEKNPATGKQEYRNFTRMTMEALVDDGVSLSEQSQSLKKLGEKSANFPPEMMEEVAAEVAEKTGKATDVRFLAMLETRFLAPGRAIEPGDLEAWKKKNEAETASKSDAEIMEMAHKERERREQKQWEAIVGKKNKDGVFEGGELQRVIASRPDVLGADIASPERFKFDAAGQERFADLYIVLEQSAKNVGRPLVLRPHVGEGYVDSDPKEGAYCSQVPEKDKVPVEGADEGIKEPKHFERSRHNLDMLIQQVDKLVASKEYDPSDPDKLVEIRFGHATHCTPEQAAAMARLGIVAEVNLSSNEATGAIQTGDKTDPDKKYDDHSLLHLINAETTVLLSTDAQSVEGTSMEDEYGKARDIIDRFRSGKTTMRMSEVEVSALGIGAEPDAQHPGEYRVAYADLPVNKREYFDGAYQKLHDDARKRGQDVREGDATDARRHDATSAPPEESPVAVLPALDSAASTTVTAERGAATADPFEETINHSDDLMIKKGWG